MAKEDKMRSRTILLFIVVIALISNNIYADVLKTISYTITLNPLTDRTNLEIEMKFDGNSEGETQISLPIDKYGTPNIHEAVSEFNVVGGNSVTSVREKPFLRIIHHKPFAPLKIYYTISWSSRSSESYAYSPIVHSDQFHFFGPQWMIKLIGNSDTLKYIVKFKKIPEEWQVFSNIGNGNHPFIQVSTQDDISGFIAGGKYHNEKLLIQESSVDIYISNRFAPRTKTYTEELKKLILYQRNLFKDYAFGYFLISLSHRDDILAGVALKNSFICLANSQTQPYKIHRLLSHEMFHTWLPNKGKIIPDEEDKASFYQFEWFHEGFTEYCGRQILLDIGVLSQENYVDLVNRDLLRLAKNPVNKITYEEVKQVIENGHFYNTHKNLSYVRGALIALSWEEKIRSNTNGKKSILDFVREIVKMAEKNGGELNKDVFFDWAVKNGIDAEKDWERYIINGKLIDQIPENLDKNYRLVDEVYSEFEPGFNISASKKAKKIIGLVEGGLAEKNGLSEGIELINIENDSNAELPIKIYVKVNNKERIISYLPTQKIPYKKYVKIK